VVLELVGESTREFGLEDRVLGLYETAELGRERDLIDIRSTFVKTRSRFFQPVTDGYTQLAPLRGSHEGYPGPTEFARVKDVEIDRLCRAD